MLAPATFPGWSWFSVSSLFAFVLRLGYINPAESFAFPLLACTSPTRSTARYLPRGGRLPGTGCEPCFFLVSNDFILAPNPRPDCTEFAHKKSRDQQRRGFLAEFLPLNYGEVSVFDRS